MTGKPLSNISRSSSSSCRRCGLRSTHWCFSKLLGSRSTKRSILRAVGGGCIRDSELVMDGVAIVEIKLLLLKGRVVAPALEAVALAAAAAGVWGTMDVLLEPFAAEALLANSPKGSED